MNGGNYVPPYLNEADVVREGANICKKILADGHRTRQINSEAVQSLYPPDRRRSMMTADGSY